MVKEIKDTVIRKTKRFFVTDDVFWNTEIESNLLVAQGMCNMSIVLGICWLLNYFDVFTVDKALMNRAVIQGIPELLIPVLICRYFKGEKRWLKFLMMLEMIIVLARLDSLLTYNVIIIIVLPVVLSTRYYSRSFTSMTASFTTLMFALSAFSNAKWEIGRVDLNYIELPKGTMLAVSDTLEHAIYEFGFDRLISPVHYLLRGFLPKILIFTIIAICCAEVARRGREMVLEQEDITSKTARIEGELTLATQIQTGMLPCIFPAFPEHKEVDIFATMNPAKEVGGDFYDYFKIDEDHIAVVMADVSGKGVPAALFMMIGKTLIKNWSQGGRTPGEVFTKVNAQLCENNEADLFITGWMGVLEVSTNKLTYVNAGHNPPVLLRRDGSAEFLRRCHGLVLACMDDSEYGESELQLEPGDTLFLYTDGVTEATNTENKLYEEERLLNYLLLHKSDDCQTLLRSLKADIDAFVGDAPQFDDITMLVMKLHEQQTKPE